MSGLDALRRFARRPLERCELCGLGVAPDHAHLVELAASGTRRLVCACVACAVLFDQGGAARYVRVPTRVTWLASFRVDDATWSALGVPVGLAFFLKSTAPSGATRITAFYPSPAGVTEAAVDDAAWGEIVRAEPAIGAMDPDVEALLVHRVGAARDHLIVPVDECYRLAGLVRRARALAGGASLAFDGGPEVSAFIDALKEERCRT